MIYITALMTNNGVPYSQYIPTVSIWNAITNAQVIVSASMTSVSNTGIFIYTFSSFSYGVPYVYLISGDPTISPVDTYKWGNAFQEVPDRTIGTVVTGTSATSFTTNRTEVSGIWNGSLCLFLSSTANLTGQVQSVTTYTNSGGTLNFTTGFANAPNTGDTFELIDF